MLVLCQNFRLFLNTLVKHQSNNHCVTLKLLVLHLTKKHEFLRTLRKHAQSLPTFVHKKRVGFPTRYPLHLIL